MARYRATVFYKDHAALGDVQKLALDVFGATARKLEGEAGYQVDVLVNDEQIGVLKSKGFRVDLIQNVDETAYAREELVGRGNRYKGR